jgi:hypothetical protein
MTEKDSSEKSTTKFKESKYWVIRDKKTGNELACGKITRSDELQVIIPDSLDAILEIEGRVCSLW